MNEINIPFSFLQDNNIVLSAKEIDFAINRKLIDLEDLEKIVDASLTKYPNDEYLLKTALHILIDGSYLNPYVQYLEIDYSGENKDDGTITTKDDFINARWKYIILLWLFVNRNNDDTDYEQVNSVYASFNYPLDMKIFINYMPIQKVSQKQGYENVLANWKDYLHIYKYLIKP